MLMQDQAHTVTDRIAALRNQMQLHQVDAVLIPSADPHLSEYLPERWQGRQWLSGFTGSMGTLLIAMQKAALFADSRYWVQAEQELAGSGIDLEKVQSATPAVLCDWMLRNLPGKSALAVDGEVLALAAAKQLRERMQALDFRLRTDLDLLATCWPARPELPTRAIYEHLTPHASRTRREKLAMLRDAMHKLHASVHIISSVDDIAWLLNLRGSDVDYNPVFLAHLLVKADVALLFVGAGKVPRELRARLKDDGVDCLPYLEAAGRLQALAGGEAVLLDPARLTLTLREAIPESCSVIESINPSTLLKSRKTEQELGFVREAMIEDGAAMCRFYAWFEQNLGREVITELTVDERLTEERSRGKGFVGLSFPTIAGFNANGAMPHYRASVTHHARLEGHGLLLIDSGAQYLGGTTDITRVWQVGDASAAMRRDFTLVLKGTMALSRCRFPRGTLAPMLDAIARAPLWAEAIDFGHGTGHGVGYFLNVHEGPQSISKAIPTPHMAMEPGMITSIEPGIYRPGSWGVRIENLVANQLLQPQTDEGFGEFLCFETLSLCPIDTRCIDTGLLREDEKQWINAYHQTVRERLSPRLQGDARAWLQTRTAAI
jgi:Xaa-Pro aminopeptidase